MQIEAGAVAAVYAVSKLADLLTDPAKVQAIPLEALPEFLAELERLRALLWSRLHVLASRPERDSTSSGDRLLSVEEAAMKLGKSKDYLYRHASKYPFTVRDGRSLRFSQRMLR